MFKGRWPCKSVCEFSAVFQFQKHEERKMKFATSGFKVLLCCLLFLLAPSLMSAQAIVDCSGATPPPVFSSISAALASLPATGPNSISVSGTCHENVIVFAHSDLNISGNPTATVVPGNASGHLLGVFNSQRVGIQNLTFTGGNGVIVDASSEVDFSGITIQNSAGIGLTSIDSLAHIDTSTIQNNTRSGISAGGGTFYVDGFTTVTGNGRIGISMLSGHLILNGGDGVTPGSQNVISGNGTVGVQVASTGEGDISADNRIINNHGTWGLLVLNGSAMQISGGTVSNNTGLGIHCGGTSHCEFAGGTLVDSNGAGGMEVVEHSDASIDGTNDFSSNTGVGILVDQSSSMTSLGGNTINNNTGDGIVLNTLSALRFEANDTITATAGNLTLNCNNGSMVEGDITTYKPKKCGNAFTDNPIH
jgi:Right handed beta helix region